MNLLSSRAACGAVFFVARGGGWYGMIEGDGEGGIVMTNILIYLLIIWMGFRYVEGILKVSTDVGETLYNLLGVIIMIMALIVYYQKNRKHEDKNVN